MPGPMATAVLSMANVSRCSCACNESVRAAVSGTGNVMASRSFPSRTSLMLAGVATVTSPAPVRSAAVAAIAAAPVLPTDPAMIPACPNVPLWAARGRARRNGCT